MGDCPLANDEDIGSLWVCHFLVPLSLTLSREGREDSCSLSLDGRGLG